MLERPLRVIVGVTAVVAVTRELGGSISLGLAIGCAIAFLVLIGSEQGENDAASDDDDGSNWRNRHRDVEAAFHGRNGGAGPSRR